MVTKPEHTKSDEIGTATSNIKELQKNPILVPISDYLKGSIIFEKEDERETSNLQKCSDTLKVLQDTGIYDDSKIASAYKEVVNIWERIAWIYQKNVSLANKQITEIKKIVENFYTTKEEASSRLELLEIELKKSQDKFKDIKNPKTPKAVSNTKQDKEEMEQEAENQDKFLERQIQNAN